MKVIIDIPDDKVQDLIGRAYAIGYNRIEPRKPWRPREMKEAVKFVIQDFVNQGGKRQ